MRRVAITGIGVVSPLGNSLRELRSALAEARPGIRRLPEEIVRGSGVQVGATVDWNPSPLLKDGEVANLDRVSQFALGAAAQALAASGLDLAAAERTRIGVSWGTGMGGAGYGQGSQGYGSNYGHGQSEQQGHSGIGQFFSNIFGGSRCRTGRGPQG